MNTESHPMRVRGLKHKVLASCTKQEVAPHAGAWIETLLLHAYPYGLTVAPHAGAWIETWP